MSIEVRAARPEEYAAVGGLVVAAYGRAGFLGGHNASYADRLRQVADRARHADVLVAVDAEDVLGSVTSCPAGSPYRERAGAGEGEFRMLAVDPGAQGRGVGERLVRACLGRSRAAGDDAMVLSTLAAMTAAHRLYERLGFRRDPAGDWSPLPGVELLVYRLDYEPSADRRAR